MHCGKLQEKSAHTCMNLPRAYSWRQRLLYANHAHHNDPVTNGNDTRYHHDAHLDAHCNGHQYHHDEYTVPSLPRTHAGMQCTLAYA